MDLLETIKLKWPKMTTIAGGPFPAVFPEMTSEYELIDIVCWGDLAQVLAQVADSIKDHKDYSEIPNLCLKKWSNSKKPQEHIRLSSQR